MARTLPPLNGLRAFESAARHLSFKRAAEELHVTPAAISQQVQGLEQFAGVKLFQRLARGLRLTDAGQAALPSIRDGFDLLARGYQRMQAQEESGIVTVSVAPSFGAKWLVPRLDRFRQRYPQFDIRLEATDALADFESDQVDVGLRYGRGEYDGLVSHRLLDEVSFPVCSPRLLKGPSKLRKPEDLRHHTLLHVEWKMEGDSAPNWRMWLHAAGVEGVDATRGPRFSMEEMAVQAAIEGHGVALIASALVVSELKSGRLVRPFGARGTGRTEFSYFVVYPEGSAARPKVAAFRDWVLEEANAWADSQA